MLFPELQSSMVKLSLVEIGEECSRAGGKASSLSGRCCGVFDSVSCESMFISMVTLANAEGIMIESGPRTLKTCGKCMMREV